MQEIHEENPQHHLHQSRLVLVRPRLLNDLHERMFKPLDVTDFLFLQGGLRG